MRLVLFFWLLSLTFALAMPWSEPSKVSDVRRDVVVPETQTTPPATVPPVLDIGGASQWMPNYIYSTVDQPRGSFAPGAAEMALGVNRYDESKGKMNVFSWTYAKYSAGLQPAMQDTEISPLSRMERPDQAAITFPPAICTKADDKTVETFSSKQSIETAKTVKGKFNVKIELGFISAEVKRGWSDTVKTYQSFDATGSSTMTKMETTAELFHWRLKDATSLSTDFARSVKDLDEWLPLQKWVSVCKTSGETLEKCAYRGYNSKLRGFVNTFGTDYMDDATLGGKMTSFKGYSTSTSATVDKKTVESKSSQSWSFSVSLMPKIDLTAQEKEEEEPAAATGEGYSTLESLFAGYIPTNTDSTETATRRLLFDTPRRIGFNAGGSSSSEESDDRQEGSRNKDTDSNSVMKFYGCTPQQDPIAWCRSCAAKPVAITYQTVPLSILVSQVLNLPDLAKRVETYIEDEYQLGCLPGWTWNKINGECEKAQSCPKGTSVTIGEVTTQVEVETDNPADGECICDCLGTTHPDLARTFVLIVNQTRVTEKAQCRSDYAEFPQCNDGRVYNCRVYDNSSLQLSTDEQFYKSVAIKSERCNETVKGLKRSTIYNCQNPNCNIKRPCEASTAIDGKGLNQDCGCPIEFTYQHCRADNTWFSCGNPNCMQNYSLATSNTSRCNSTEIKPINNCWCGEQSSEWKRCDSDQSWFLERKPAFRDYQSSNAMAKECNSKRMCASDNSLFENACDIRGFPCDTLRGNETSSSNVENQNQVCFAAATGGLTAFTCTKCEPGTFSSGANSPQCEDCPAGKTSYDAGASACEDCPNGGSGYMCQDKVVPFDAQVLMRGSSQTNVIANPCGFRGGEAYAGCWDLDHGILKKQLKNGDNCDFTEVALPKGVAIKLYSFHKGGYWPTNGQLGGDKCCETDSIASEDSLETCTGDDAQQVQYRGTVQADNSIDGQEQRPSYFQNFKALDAAANVRRLLGSRNNEEMVCMYNIHLMEGYTCADKPGSA